MNRLQNFAHLAFHPDFSAALHEDGTQIEFTRSESALLSHMSQRVGQVMSRGQLLDVISGAGSDKNDRNIDFLINRLRRKLGDDPKDPRFIATRYGEGYVWRAGAAKPKVNFADATMVVGPVRQLDIPPDMVRHADNFAQNLYHALASNLRDNQKAVFDKACPPAEEFGTDVPETGVALTFFAELDRLECVITAKTFRTGLILTALRIPIGTVEEPWRTDRNHANDIGQDILGKIWKASITESGTPAPLPVTMNNAAGLAADDRGSWAVNDNRLKALRRSYPDDDTLKIMYATHLHSKYVLGGLNLFMQNEDDYVVDENEIERLVLDALPFAQSKPEFAVMAAKLLFFLDRGFRDLAVDIAEDAHRSNTVIASTLAIVGQMRGFMGQMEPALQCLNQAAVLSNYGSDFHIYVLVLKCQALMAAGDAEGLNTARKELYSARPAVMVVFEFLFTDHRKPSLRARTAVMLLTRAKARALLRKFDYLSTRLFQIKAHQENSIRTPLELLIRRFGRDIVPDRLADSLPELIEELAAK